MLPKQSPTELKSWKKLQEISKDFSLSARTGKDRKNLGSNEWRVDSEDLVFDFSRNLMDHQVLESLLDLANEARIKDSIDSMFGGEKINETENRAVLHPALRSPDKFNIELDGANVRNQVNSALVKIKSFAEKLERGEMLGFNGQKISDIINIGIGGSDLGPMMVCEALKDFRIEGIRSHFVSNVDPYHLEQTLKNISPETSLFIIASKTFTTQETMANAKTAKGWFLKNGGSEDSIVKHFVAVSTNLEETKDFGIPEENVFGFWDWVGGRYSLWSSIGLSISCSIGYKNFSSLLKGAAQADHHFQDSDFEKNIPVLMALIGIWNNNFLGAESEAVLPYSQALHRFPAYLQQANMESNGKSVDRNGNPVDYDTGPIVWGEAGTNGQHAFYQLIHQGTHLIPCDFILFTKTRSENKEQNAMLLANGLAQSKALWEGRSIDQVKEQIQQGKTTQFGAPYKVFRGLNPSNTLLFKDLSPESLGFLIALYEHKIFVQGLIWNIFSFDQWGVELGKELAGKLLPILKGNSPDGLDGSTKFLINKISKWR